MCLHIQCGTKVLSATALNRALRRHSPFMLHEPWRSATSLQGFACRHQSMTACSL